MNRLATTSDIPGIVDIVKTEAMEAFGGWSDEAALPIVQLAVETGRAFVIEDGGVIAATLGLEVCNWWTSGEPFIGDRWLGVHREHRRRGYGTVLINIAKSYAAERGLTLLLGISSHIDVGPKMEIYGEHMRPFGGLFYFRGKM